MSEAEEIAKAIQEFAKLGEKGLETAQKAGGFLAKLFKEPLYELRGIISDKLRFVRWKCLVNMSDEVNQILLDKGITKTRAVQPKLALPILEEASLEEDPNIQTLWNHLLANAMDPDFNDELRYGFIDMIKNLTGVEAALINYIYTELDNRSMLRPIENLHRHNVVKEHLIQHLKLTNEQYALAANNLMRMQLIAPAILTGGISMGLEPITVYKGIDAITLTPLGAKFVEACMK